MRKIVHLFFVLQMCQSLAQNKSSEQVIDSILKTITSKTSNQNIINSYAKIALEYSSLDSEQGILYAKKALKLSEKIKWEEGKSMALISLGENYYCQGKFSEAMKNYETAFQFTKRNCVTLVFRI